MKAHEREPVEKRVKALLATIKRSEGEPHTEFMKRVYAQALEDVRKAEG